MVGDGVKMYSVMETAIEPTELEPTIDELKARIKRHGRYLRKNETRTRQVLVDPLLRELGWNVEDPDSVELEFRGKGLRPDYALMLNRSAVALVEAKKLGANLDDANDQLMMYALDRESAPQVSVVACTNGDKWVLWRSSGHPKVIEFRLSKGDTFDTAYGIIDFLSRANFLKEAGRSAVRSAPAEGGWYSLGGSVPSDAGPPIAIRFGDGTTVAVRYWLDTHIAVARHLLETGALKRAMVPVSSPRGGRYLIAKSPYHADGKPFRNEKEFADGLWLDGSGGARWTLLECAELVEACGQDPGTVRVRFG